MKLTVKRPTASHYLFYAEDEFGELRLVLKSYLSLKLTGQRNKIIRDGFKDIVAKLNELEKNMKQHPQAEILRAIADGKTVQMRNALRGSQVWTDEPTPFEYLSDDRFEWRVKPETININGHEVPRPVREPLTEDQDFYVVAVTQIRRPRCFRWNPDSDVMQSWLKRGLIHLTEAAAIAHAEALLSFTRSDE